MICVSIQKKGFGQILEAVSEADMAEIRLDLCPLSDADIEELFSATDIPLIATCRAAANGKTPTDADWAATEKKLCLAAKAGATYIDLELEAPASLSKKMRTVCRDSGSVLIRSWHDFSGTPDKAYLQQVMNRCFRYGASIAKIVTTATCPEDTERILSLYDCTPDPIPGEDPSNGPLSTKGTLVAFAMGDEGRGSRLDCLKKGAPFTYAALCEDEATAPGQWSLEDMKKAVYGNFKPYIRHDVPMPASKSFAQRAIICAALADGTSHLRKYSPCDDSEAAIRVARTLGATVRQQGDSLEITGIGPLGPDSRLHLDSLNVGESGLLTRLMIPILSQLAEGDFRIEGEGTLPGRPLGGASDIMASYGVMLRNVSPRADREIHVPLTVCGHLIPGTAELPGEHGSQLISGLLMTLPLCGKDITLYVNDPKSIPYMFITTDVLRLFGIKVNSQMEGDAEMIESEDWSYCTGISFKIRGGQRYKAADFDVEADWSSAAPFLVAGALFGDVSLTGLDSGSLQADISILDILVDAGACVSELEDGTVCVRKAPLSALNVDLSNAPDLFPAVSVLAAFCSGDSVISGSSRLCGKESDRAAAILEMLRAMGVRCEAGADFITIKGESLESRILSGHLLRGGNYSSHHDHRMAMALRLASLATESPIVIDDEACVGKSFPDFFKLF